MLKQTYANMNKILRGKKIFEKKIHIYSKWKPNITSLCNHKNHRIA